MRLDMSTPNVLSLKRFRKRKEREKVMAETALNESNASTNEDSLGQLYRALAKAQGEMKPAFKDKENPFFKSRYSSLDAIWDACREALSKNGLAVIQRLKVDGDRTILITELGHVSGANVSSELAVKPVKQDPQSMGSAITYAKRFTLGGLVGVVTSEDDDGNVASGKIDSEEKYMPAPIPSPSALKITPKDQKPTIEQLKNMNVLARNNGYTKEDLQGYVFNSWEIRESSQLTLDEYYKLIDLISSKTLPVGK
jgi:hypothetical protein